LTKDFGKAVKQMCHLLTESNYPKFELDKYKKQRETTANNIVNSPDLLADNIQREVSRRGSIISYPIGGRSIDVLALTSRELREELNYLLEVPKKTVYLLGPKNGLKRVKSALLEDCRFRGTFVREIDQQSIQVSNPGIFFLPVSEFKQSTVSIGVHIQAAELPTMVDSVLTSRFFGGRNGSVLHKEIREKRGLVYSIEGGFVTGKSYGRGYIIGQTKNESTADFIKLVHQVVADLKLSDETRQIFDISRKDVNYNIYSAQESDQSYLNFLYTIATKYGLSVNDISSFGEMFDKVSESDAIGYIKRIFDPARVTIVVVGNESILADLQTLGEVEILDLEDFL
jgi:predicted Zn-dependent peptidase